LLPFRPFRGLLKGMLPFDACLLEFHDPPPLAVKISSEPSWN
jgi:hypothetical protein